MTTGTASGREAPLELRVAMEPADMEPRGHLVPWLGDVTSDLGAALCGYPAAYLHFHDWRWEQLDGARCPHCEAARAAAPGRHRTHADMLASCKEMAVASQVLHSDSRSALAASQTLLDRSRERLLTTGPADSPSAG